MKNMPNVRVCPIRWINKQKDSLDSVGCWLCNQPICFGQLKQANTRLLVFVYSCTKQIAIMNCLGICKLFGTGACKHRRCFDCVCVQLYNAGGNCKLFGRLQTVWCRCKQTQTMFSIVLVYSCTLRWHL